MKTIEIGATGVAAPAVAVGCMRLHTLDDGQAEAYLGRALELGAVFFDHADIYGGGTCEEIFGRAIHMTPAVREKIILQTKAGIVPHKMYDFSREHLTASIEASLRKLKTEYLDFFLLHRPDTLGEPEEVAALFSALYESGKVRHFGVSNHTPLQIELLQRYVDQPLAINQMQFGPVHTPMVDSGINANMFEDEAIDRDGGVLDYCRLKRITIQAWSPFQLPEKGGVFLNSPDCAALNSAIDELAEAYGVTPTAIVVAWVLRHPAAMQVIAGTMNAGRLEECVAGSNVRLTREEWYRIYRAAGNPLP